MATYSAFPTRPSQSLQLNLGHNLAAGLLFAASYGQLRGYGINATIPQIAERNLSANNQGQWVGTMAPQNVQQSLPGGTAYSNNGLGGACQITYVNPRTYAIGAGLSMFIVVRDFSFNGGRMAAGLKEGVGLADRGICINGNGPSAWEANVSNGAAQVTATGAAGTRVLGSWQTVCASWNSADQFNLYVDGAEAATLAGGGLAPIGNPSRVRVFESPTFNDGQVAVVYIWERAISRVQVRTLHADPFVLFRPPTGVQRRDTLG